MQKSRVQNRAISLLLTLLCLGAIGLAWAAEPLILTPKDSGKTLTLTVGRQRFGQGTTPAVDGQTNRLGQPRTERYCLEDIFPP